MQKVDNARSTQKTVKAGLRILAKIIAREAVNNRLEKMDGKSPDPLYTDAMPAEVNK